MKTRRSFDHAPASVALARRFAGESIKDVPTEIAQTVELMVSELASNCIRHTDSRFELTVTRTPREIRVQVTDTGTGEPIKRSPAPDDPSGRGLQIVDLLSASWGVEHLQGRGKRVWFSVMAPSGDRAAVVRSTAERSTS